MSPFAAVPSSGVALLAALLLAPVPTPIAAQQPRRVAEGDWIRVETTTQAGKRFAPTAGMFLGGTGDTVFVGTEASIAAIHRPSVQRVELSLGHNHWRSGALIGGVLGVAFGGVAVRCREGEDCDGQVEVLGAMILGAIASGVGAVVGLGIPGTGPWIRAELPSPAPAKAP